MHIVVAALVLALSILAPPDQSMRWRYIGPTRGGRTVAISGVASNPYLYYMAAVNGGVWKSDDAGRTWTPTFDGEPTQSIGALAVAPSDPKIIYAGSGEALLRPDLSTGDGIYKSTDGGASWNNMGIRGGEQIAAIAVDPHNADHVFVAVLGHPYGPNVERGIYRTTDGGVTWQRVLYQNSDTGAYDVVIDPHDHNIVYATLWAARQAPWEIGPSFEVGGGVFKSLDGGTTWRPLTKGLPDRVGRTEVAIAPSNQNVVYVYADIESDGNDSGALYRSDDAGSRFRKVNEEETIAQRGQDLVSIAVDPQDTNTLYLTNLNAYRSTDGGKTFVAFKGTPGGDDYHSIWINPTDSNIIMLGGDQGATISLNHGRTWSSWYNQPTAQMYHVFTDDRFPYLVCGAQQESGSACVSSRGNWGEITQRDWFTVGAFEYGYVVEDPLHQGIFFSEHVNRFDERSGQWQDVSPMEPSSEAYRTVRTEPLIFDHIDKHRLYAAANVIFATEDGGRHWKVISPDLTREHPAVPAIIRSFEGDDPEKGRHRGVVYALAPSYRSAGTLWAGTDDGLVWITRDGGEHWKNVTPPGLTAWSKISQIDASRFDNNTAFVAVNRMRLDDNRPYVFATHDGGTRWRLIIKDLPNAPVNAVRQDPVVSQLLYAATERGVHVSFNAGASWESLQFNLPHTSVRDLVIAGNDIAIATHGRGFWILDDVEPLRELARDGIAKAVRLFAPEPAFRVVWNVNTDEPLPPEEPMGQNPPDGAIIDYWLPTRANSVSIEIADSNGTLMRRFASSDIPATSLSTMEPVYWQRPFTRPDLAAGMHRFVWNLRRQPPKSSVPSLPFNATPHDTEPVPQGVLVLPGRYRVILEVDGYRSERILNVLMDPRAHISTSALRRQYDLAHKLESILNRSYSNAEKARQIGHFEQAEQFDAVNAQAGTLLEEVEAVDADPTPRQAADESMLMQTLNAANLDPQRG